MQQAYFVMHIVVLILLAIGMLFALLRAIHGPRIADRIIGGNLVGTMTIMAIAVLADLLNQDWLLDVCLIYCMISFLAVIVLCKTYIGVDQERKNRAAQKEADEE